MEVVGEANAILVTDRMLKTSEVEYVTQDTKCGGHALVFVGGDVAAVKAAVDAVKEDPPCESDRDGCDFQSVTGDERDRGHVQQPQKKISGMKKQDMTLAYPAESIILLIRY